MFFNLIVLSLCNAQNAEYKVLYSASNKIILILVIAWFSPGEFSLTALWLNYCKSYDSLGPIAIKRSLVRQSQMGGGTGKFHSRLQPVKVLSSEEQVVTTKLLHQVDGFQPLLAPDVSLDGCRVGSSHELTLGSWVDAHWIDKGKVIPT